MTEALQFEAVTKRYDSLTALNGVSFTAEPGQVVGLLGPNGAGKSTLIKLAIGLIGADGGAVITLGRNPRGRGARALRAEIGYLPENVSFYEQLTGREVLRYLGRLKKVPDAEQRGLIERVGLGAASERKVKTYSKGMRQRLGLAQAIMGGPRLLLMDEPTSGLDPMAVRDFYIIIDELCRGGVSVLLSSHVLAEIEPRLHRAVVLGRGCVLAAGSVADMRREAHLPITVRVRGRITDAGRLDRLRRAGASVLQLNGKRMEIETLADAKIDVLRTVLGAPEVSDVEVLEPTLEKLYAHIAATAQEEGTSCTRH